MEFPADLRTIGDAELSAYADDAHAFEIACRIELHARGQQPSLSMANRPRWAQMVVGALGTQRRGGSFSPKMLIVAFLFTALLSLPAIMKFAAAFATKLQEVNSTMEKSK